MENTYVSSELTPSCNVPMDARSPSVESQQILATCLTHGAGMISVAGLRRGDRPQYILYAVGTAASDPSLVCHMKKHSSTRLEGG